ncbi:MAG: metallophosphoesterase [Deltaproteobacteria bacterium]|nr:metallophosphoesterase [Deltaproteobacteria bacterium]
MTTIAYITDVEGQWPKVEDFAQDNALVSLAGETLTVQNGARLVFGGDAIDRGPNGRKVMRALLDVKRRQPDQVVLLAGNRDINKLRLWRELQGHFFDPVPDDLQGADAATVLRWIFKYTMGAGQGFVHRQAELAAEGEDASDLAVPQSFLDDVRPGGLLAEYLRACTLAHREGATLFVHGGVTHESLGHVPGLARIDDPDAWAAALNAWYAGNMALYYDRAVKDPQHAGWNELIAYQAPVKLSRRNQASVVYGRTADDQGNPHLPDDQTMKRLTTAKIHRLIVGHTPSGDAPSILRAPDFELVFADNSYSPLEHGNRLIVTDDAIDVRARARLFEGKEVDVAFALKHADRQTLIGLRDEKSGHLVKGKSADGRYLLQRFGEQYRLEQLAEGLDALQKRPLAPPT